MRKMVATVAAVLVLSGCAAEAEETPTVAAPATEQTTEAETPASEASNGLAIQAEPEPETETLSAEAQYLENLRAFTDRPTLMNASDEQLLAAGEEACGQLAETGYYDKVQVIEDEQLNDKGRYADSLAIAANAKNLLCPEVEAWLSPPAG